MNLPAAINVLRWLIWDTFCQGLASRISWLMMTITIVAILFCASIGLKGERSKLEKGEENELVPAEAATDPEQAERSGVRLIRRDRDQLTIGFGAIGVGHPRDAVDTIHFLQLILSSGVAGTLGVLLTLVWTAGFLPSFLEPQAASVLLTKPVPRWIVLLGKFIGMNLFVGLQAALFVGGTWFTLGFATGVWTWPYLLAVPLLMLQFAFFYSFSMFLAVATRSTVVCVIGSVLFWVVCAALNGARIQLVLQPDAPALLRWPAEFAYWLLPKPLDFSLLMSHALNSEHHFAQWSALQAMEQQGRYLPDISLITSLLFGIAMVLVSAVDVRKVDY